MPGCSQCRHESPAGARFCEACGASLQNHCPRCHAQASPNAHFCHICGQGLHATAPREETFEGERRQATVMFCDLSGYTRLGERLDPEEIEELVGQIKARAVEIVERHGGTVSQFQGDGMLVLFGVPVAHDDDPVRAVRAARAMHTMVRSISPEVELRAAQQLRLHSGVSSGLVVTSGRDARDGMIGVTGDSVNLAARLAAFAGPDEILVSSDTCRHIVSFFETQALDPVSFKGKAEAVVAHRVERETPTQTRFEAAERRGLTRFSGRHHELAQLQDALRRAAEGSGQLVTVSGEPGMGKSRLAFEFRHGIDRRRAGVLEGRCLSHGMASPYLPFIDVMRRSMQWRDDEPYDALHDRAVASIRALDEELSAYLPHYLHLLSIPSVAYPLPVGLEGMELRESLEQALVALVTAYARRRPLALILEDWHWADDGSLATVTRLTSSLQTLPLMILVLYRPELSIDWSASANHTHLALHPMHASETEAMLRSMLGAASLPQGLSELVHERTAGNPFFTEEVTAALRDQGHLVIRDNVVEASGPLETLDLPETVQATIRARVDRLHREHRQVLRVASVLGREFSRRVLEQTLSLGNSLDSALDALVAQDLLQQLRLLPESRYMFKHVLIQGVVYETLLHQQRKTLHDRAGQAIERLYADRLEEQYEALAHHYSHSSDATRALQYLQLAADKAAGLFSLAAARLHYQNAIALLDRMEKSQDSMQKRIALTLKLARASHYAASNETLKTLEVAREYARTLDDRHQLARVTAEMGGIYRMLGEHKRVFALLTETATLAREVRDDELLAYAFHVMGRACYLTGDYTDGIRYMAEGISLSERHGNLAEVSYSCGFSADCHAWLGNFSDALPLAQRSMQLAVDSDDISRQGGANWYLAAVCCMHGDWEQGLAAADCTGFARRIGGAYLIGAGLSAEGWARFMLGDRDHGLELMLEGLRMMEASGSKQGTGLYASWIADASAVAGKREQAVHYARKALDFLKDFGEGNGEAPAYRALALAGAQEPLPDWSAIAQQMMHSARAAEKRAERPQLAITSYRYAEVLHRKGDPDAATAQLERAEQLFAETGMRWWQQECANLRGLLNPPHTQRTASP